MHEVFCSFRCLKDDWIAMRFFKLRITQYHPRLPSACWDFPCGINLLKLLYRCGTPSCLCASAGAGVQRGVITCSKQFSWLRLPVYGSVIPLPPMNDESLSVKTFDKPRAAACNHVLLRPVRSSQREVNTRGSGLLRRRSSFRVLLPLYRCAGVPV